ncbi:MAG: hypothetical protein ACREC6_12455, partial [Hyphomicrobiaceae bacterium]
MPSSFKTAYRNKVNDFSYAWKTNKAFAGMVWASLVLGVASFYTTFAGLYNFNLGWFTSAAVSLGVQSFMAILAFVLGGVLAREDAAKSGAAVWFGRSMSTFGLAVIAYAIYLAMTLELDGLRLVGCLVVGVGVMAMASVGRQALAFLFFMLA